MLINVLICKADGTQAVEQREVPENWFDTQAANPKQESGNTAAK